MDQDWTRKVAIKAAKQQCESAAVLLRTAHDIFKSVGHDVDAANVSEAPVYIEEVLAD